MRRQGLGLFLIISFIQTVKSMEVSSIQEICSQVEKCTQKKDTNTVWWVTDIDGMLVDVCNDYCLIEKGTVTTFKKIESMVGRVIGLTRAELHWSVPTSNALTLKGMNFFYHQISKDKVVPLGTEGLSSFYNGLIFTVDDKGKALSYYLSLIENLPKSIVFSDDKKENVESVVTALKKNYPIIEIIGLHYVPLTEL